MPGISLAGHLGGLVGGGLLAFVFPVYGEQDSVKKSWRLVALFLYTAWGHPSLCLGLYLLILFMICNEFVNYLKTE